MVYPIDIFKSEDAVYFLVYGRFVTQALHCLEEIYSKLLYAKCQFSDGYSVVCQNQGTPIMWD